MPPSSSQPPWTPLSGLSPVLGQGTAPPLFPVLGDTPPVVTDYRRVPPPSYHLPDSLPLVDPQYSSAEWDSFLSYTRRLTAEKEQSARDARAAADDARLARDKVEATRKTLALERERVTLMQ